MRYFSNDPDATQSLARWAKETFEERGRSVSAWRHHGQALLDAAHVLWDSIEKEQSEEKKHIRLLRFGPIAAMLGGLAVETLAKAARVRQDPTLISDGEWRLRTHRLLQIVPATGLSLDPLERSVLGQVEGFVDWAGRYPIPLTAERMTPTAISKGSEGRKAVELPPGFLMRTDDRRVIDRVVSRLNELLTDEEKA